MTDELLTHKVGGWTVVEHLGSGKSAIVFRATRNNESAALKVFDPELRDRFGKEAQLERIERELSLGGDGHPNLVRIIDGGECRESGFFFVVMELVHAPSLNSVVAHLPRERIWPIISQVAEAARFLEEHDLAHRDIKPSNIAVTPDFENATLLDLGVIRPFGVGDLTDGEQLTFLGTLRYAPPEFLLRTEQDTCEGWRAVTFYQLGGTLYDMIMRARLFEESSDPFARLIAAVQEEIPRLEASDVSPDLVLLASNCLLKDPALRLKLLNWQSFTPYEFRPDSLDDAKRRILSRQVHARQSSQEHSELDAEQAAREEQRTLDELRSRLEAIVRLECIASHVFPPLEIHPQMVSSGRAETLVSFGASAGHGLARPLQIWLTVTLLDRKSSAVQLACVAAASSVRLNADAVGRHPPTVLFEGVFQESVVRRLVGGVFCLLLDSAQQLGDSVREHEDEQQWIFLKVQMADLGSATHAS